MNIFLFHITGNKKICLISPFILIAQEFFNVLFSLLHLIQFVFEPQILLPCGLKRLF